MRQAGHLVVAPLRPKFCHYALAGVVDIIEFDEVFCH